MLTSATESYSEDRQTAKGLSPEDQRVVYANIATGAETGWDFSSRWFADGRTLSKIVARNIVPVDLNNIVYVNEIRMADMYSIAGNNERAAFYSQAAFNRSIGMMAVLWNNKNGQWYVSEACQRRNLTVFCLGTTTTT